MKLVKLFSFFIVIVLCLTNTQCEDDDFIIIQIDVNNNTGIKIENNETAFNVNESITVETNILNEQTTIDGQNILLTDYDYAEIGQSKYQYTLVLYKLKSFGTIAEIPLTVDSITNIEGETRVEDGNIIVKSFYDGTAYKNKFSITIPEAGTFYLAGNRFLIDRDGKLRINGGIPEKALLKINSVITNSNVDGGYEFTVN